MAMLNTRYRKPELKLQPVADSLKADGEPAADSDPKDCENIQKDSGTLSGERRQSITNESMRSTERKDDLKQEVPPVLNQPGKIKKVKRVSFSEEVEEFYTTASEGELPQVKFSKSLLSSTGKAVHPNAKKDESKSFWKRKHREPPVHPKNQLVKKNIDLVLP